MKEVEVVKKYRENASIVVVYSDDTKVVRDVGSITTYSPSLDFPGCIEITHRDLVLTEEQKDVFWKEYDSLEYQESEAK